MNIDIGLAVVIVAVLIFYLRLIGMQREKAKQAATPAKNKSKGKKGKAAEQTPQQRYSIISPHPQDRIIAGVGAAAILIGVLLNAGIIPLPGIQTYWWIPTAAGIVAFSWAFKV